MSHGRSRANLRALAALSTLPQELAVKLRTPAAQGASATGLTLPTVLDDGSALILRADLVAVVGAAAGGVREGWGATADGLCFVSFNDTDDLLTATPTLTHYAELETTACVDGTPQTVYLLGRLGA